MIKWLLLFLIIICGSILRLWQIGKVPPLIDASLINGRLLSAILNISSIPILFLYVKSMLSHTKISLLTVWIFTVLPWTIEQSRIISQPNFALFSLLFFLLVTKLFSNSSTSEEANRPPSEVFIRKSAKLLSAFRIIIYLVIPLSFYFIYPQFWLFKVREFNFSINSLINNLFILLSFDFLFFKNITFWWGGVREVGVMYLSFLPFFLLGIYNLVSHKKYNTLVWFLFITIISALSPYFPESREFYLATPFIAIITGMGIYSFYRFLPEVSFRWLLLILFLSVLVYEISEFLHYYTIHYPQQILSNLSKINEPF